MNRMLLLIIPFSVFAIVFSLCIIGAETTASAQETEQSKLLVVWTSGDRDVALKMVFMYADNAKLRGWWDEVQLLVWGPSSKLLSTDTELQEYVGKMKENGVILTACKACADQYGVSETLSGMGIDVKYMGVPLTEMLKSGWTTVTF